MKSCKEILISDTSFPTLEECPLINALSRKKKVFIAQNLYLQNFFNSLLAKVVSVAHYVFTAEQANVIHTPQRPKPKPKVSHSKKMNALKYKSKPFLSRYSGKEVVITASVHPINVSSVKPTIPLNIKGTKKVVVKNVPYDDISVYDFTSTNDVPISVLKQSRNRLLPSNGGPVLGILSAVFTTVPAVTTVSTVIVENSASNSYSLVVNVIATCSASLESVLVNLCIAATKEYMDAGEVEGFIGRELAVIKNLNVGNFLFGENYFAEDVYDDQLDPDNSLRSMNSYSSFLKHIRGLEMPIIVYDETALESQSAFAQVCVACFGWMLPSGMDVAFWNVRGSARNTLSEELKFMCCSRHINILALCDTKSQFPPSSSLLSRGGF